MVSITQKQKDKILGYFDQFLMCVRKMGRITTKTLQRMLGLQIWVSTVFRIARQFLTSTCDALRQSNRDPLRIEKFFFPRKNPVLTARIVFDLKFWRRFVLSSPQSSFKSILGLLPKNRDRLFCDASSTHGMGGVLQFDARLASRQEIKGLFWQITWEEWNTIVTIPGLGQDKFKKNEPEFLAALITCESFAKRCAGKFTTLALDNFSAKSWLDSARCPSFPFDRCAQGVHLHMLDLSMKINTSWVSSAENKIADMVSRTTFNRKRSSHRIAGVNLRNIRPKWSNVLRFL